MTHKRKSLIILAVLLILASTGLVAFAMQPSARDLLVESLEMTELITDGHAIATVEFDAQGESGSGMVELWGKVGMGPNGEPAFRAEVLEASLSEFVGITAVTDGDLLDLGGELGPDAGPGAGGRVGCHAVESAPLREH